MRVPIFRVTNDDDPSDYDYPIAVSLETLVEANPGGDIEDFAPQAKVGDSLTVGGGAAVQFTLTRIR